MAAGSGTFEGIAFSGSTAASAPLAVVSLAASAVMPGAPGQALHARWGEQMVQALRNSAQVQIQQRIQHATIRLDPPHMGSLEVSVSHEAGRVQVHINATHADVARMLSQGSERLRQDLAEQNFVHVSVSVSADADGRQHARRPTPAWTTSDPQAAQEQPDGVTHRATPALSDVLVTV